MENIFSWIAGGSLVLSMVTAVCASLLPVVILGGLGIFIYQRSKNAGAARQAAQMWPGVRGVVVMSTTQTRQTGRSVSVVPVVVYQYTIDGQLFQGQVVRAGDQSGTIRVTGDAQNIVQRYPVGGNVAVYYNPANPAEAVLER